MRSDIDVVGRRLGPLVFALLRVRIGGQLRVSNIVRKSSSIVDGDIDLQGTMKVRSKPAVLIVSSETLQKFINAKWHYVLVFSKCLSRKCLARLGYVDPQAALAAY